MARRTTAAIVVAVASFAAAVVAVVAFPVAGYAAAPSPTQIGLEVEPSSAAYPQNTRPLLHLRVTNLSETSCALAATSELTLVVLEATRDGQPLVPTYVRSLPNDGAAATVTNRAHSVGPRDALPFDLDLTGLDAVVTSVALDDGSTLSASYPVLERGRYEFRLAYAMPPSSWGAGSPTACTGMSDDAMVAFTVGAPAGMNGGVPWYLIAAVVVGLLVLAVLVLWLRRRARRRGARGSVAGATALVLLAAASLVTMEGLTVRPASAGVVYGADPSKNQQIYNTYLGCIGKIAGFDPGLFTDLNNVDVVVLPWTDSKQLPKGSGTGSIIGWDPFGGTGFTGETSGATYDPCAGLYHELNHARDHAQDKDSGQYCDDTGVLLDEVRATIAENRYRAAQKPPLKPRTTYDGKKIPSSMDGCTPPKKKADNGATNPGVCRGIDGPCGLHTGDPHLLTIDGYRFDFQAVGEFVAVHSSAGDMEIQVRQSPSLHSRVVSVNTAVAIQVAGTRLGFSLDQSRVTVHRDGSATTVPIGTTDLPGGAKVNHAVDPSRGDSFAVVWPDGSAAWVVQSGVWGLTLAVQPRASRSGNLTGLLGPFDGDASNDVSTVDRKALAQPPSFDDLYRTYAPGWRVSDSTSLFDYAPGTTTKDFTDLTFPDRPAPADSLPPAQQAAAQAACALLGVSEPAALADCVVDVGHTGQAMFAIGSALVQAATGSGAAGGSDSGSIGEPQTIIVAGEGVGRISFDATAGQRAYVDVVSTTLPDACGIPELHSPQGAVLAIGCLFGGKGSIDATALPVTGRYEVVARPPAGVTGSITMRIILSQDLVGEITPDGPPVTMTVTVAGQIARLNFAAVAGQRLFLDVPSSTVPPGCGQIGLAPTTGSFFALGCTDATGAGLMDTAEIRQTGTYSVLLDPSGDATGSATVKLTIVDDEHQAIVLNGPSRVATVSEAGAQSLLTFSGTAGQQVTVEATGASSQLVGCGSIVLRDPAGGTIDLGCINAEGTGVMGPTTLPVPGTYTIVVDPGDRRTGSVTLRAHT